MSPKPPPKIPPFRIHKASGQGYVSLGGKRIYLGRHDQPGATEATIA